MKKSVYRIILMVGSGLLVLFFFVLPYATLSEVLGALSGLASGLVSGLGLSNPYPSKLTGLALIKAVPYVEEFLYYAFILVPPVVMALFVFLMNLFGKKRLSYVGSIILSVFMIGLFGLSTFLASLLTGAGYKLGLCGPLSVVISLVIFIVSIIGCVKDSGKAGQTAKSGKSVKPGKKDGTITGLSGAYAGAVIPVKSGDTVTIGRDPSVCSIVAKGEKVSRKHCTVAFNGDNGMYAVTDYSSNGTFDEAGNRLARTVATPMTAGSVIVVGGEKFRLG